MVADSLTILAIQNDTAKHYLDLKEILTIVAQAKTR